MMAQAHTTVDDIPVARTPSGGLVAFPPPFLVGFDERAPDFHVWDDPGAQA